MPMNAELLALGNRKKAMRSGAIGLLFHEGSPIVMRSLREDKYKEEAVFGPEHIVRSEQNQEAPEILQLFAQGFLADVWTSPGGAMEPGESAVQTISREFSEEVVMSLEDNRPHEMRLADKITKSPIRIQPFVNFPIPVVVQTNKHSAHEEPYLRGVFEVQAARIDLTDDQFYPLCGAGIFRYLTDVHSTESLRPTVKYLWLAYSMVENHGRRVIQPLQ